MARNISPQCKQCRREGEKMFLKGERCNSSKCAMVKRNYVPGAHGNKGKPRISGYGLQLREKQRAKRTYGLLEKQFHNYYLKASKKSDNTADVMLNFLELRFDNVVYKAGLAGSRKLARQLVSHSHFFVNGKRCNVASRQIKVGDKITVKESQIEKKYWQELIKTLEKKDIPEWLSLDKKSLALTVKAMPELEDIKKSIAMNLIIEYYSR